MAAVCLAPSRPNDTHRVANWVTVPVAWDGAADNGQDGGAELWSALGSRPAQEDQLGLGLPLCVSSPTFEFGLGINTANEHGQGGRPARGSAGQALLPRQGEFSGERCWLRTQRPLLHGVVILRGLPAREIGPNERPRP